MPFKLAEGYVEFKARTESHDRSVDKLLNKLKLVDFESQKIQKTTAKAFLGLAAGVGSATAGILLAATALRDLVGRMMEAAKAGEHVGNAIARWAHEITGLKNAVVELDNAQKRGASISAGIASPGPKVPPIAGVSTDQNAEFQARRRAMNESLILAQQEQTTVQNLARKELEVHRKRQQEGVLGLVGARRQTTLSEDTQNRLDAANQQVQRVELAMKHLGFEIEETVKKNTDAVFEQQRVTKAQKEFSDAMLSDINPAINTVGQGLAALSNLFARGEFAALIAIGTGARAVAHQAREQRIGRQDAILQTMNPLFFDLGEKIGQLSSVLAVKAGMAPKGDVNELPEEMVDVGGVAPDHRNTPRQRRKATMMGAEEFGRAMLQGTAGGDEAQKIRKEQLKNLESIEATMKKVEENTAQQQFGVFAPGEGVVA